MFPRSKNIFIFAGVVLLVLVIGIVLLLTQYNTPEPTLETPTTSRATLTKAVIGHSVEGRDIVSYTFGSGDTHLLFVGGIHGGYEWNSILVAYNLVDYLGAHVEDVPENLSITIVPNANPDAVYKVTQKEGRFTEADVTTSADTLKSARFNADEVDLNRNFSCNWQPTGTWQNKTVSAGSEVFSEPEARAIRDLVQKLKPIATVFWHSASGAVYAAHCSPAEASAQAVGDSVSDAGRVLMNTYAKAANYPSIDTFDSYPVNGAADDWMSTIELPAITVELSTHDTLEWDKNLAGIKAVIERYAEGSRP